jgi:phenylalanyl-tRNA synthetase alpha chain
MPTPVPSLISTRDLVAALEIRDLSDPAHGPHAVQLLLDEVVGALSTAWGCAVEVRRRHPLVAVEDNYDRLGYAATDLTRDCRYSRYVGETVMLRSHTSAGIPPALRSLAQEGRDGDALLVLPGLCYRRDSIDRLHVGTPHQVDLWRVTPSPQTEDDLEQMVGLVVGAVLPGAAWRTVPARHPYTHQGRQVDVRTEQGWVELAECGLAASHVLAGAGLDPSRCTSLALGMGLDRAVLLRKGLPDIRLLRAGDPRVAVQLRDLQPWRPVSSQPAVRRDLSVVVDAGTDAELLGDAVRQGLGSDADDLEAVTIVATTPYGELPSHVRERLGLRPDQANVLLRLVLRPLTSTLTDQRANQLRDRVYAAVHRGPHAEWASARSDADEAHNR